LETVEVNSSRVRVSNREDAATTAGEVTTLYDGVEVTR